VVRGGRFQIRELVTIGRTLRAARLREAGRRAWRVGQSRRVAVGGAWRLNAEIVGPPAGSICAAWRACGEGEDNPNCAPAGASRGLGLGRIGGIVACNPNCRRAPNTRMKLQAL
jgi:hypothetical protein